MGYTLPGARFTCSLSIALTPPFKATLLGAWISDYGVSWRKHGLTDGESEGYTAILHRPPSAVLAVRYHNEEHNAP